MRSVTAKTHVIALNNPTHLKNNLLFFKTLIEILPHSDKQPPVVSPQRSIPMQRQPILSDWSWLMLGADEFNPYDIPNRMDYELNQPSPNSRSYAPQFDSLELEDVPF